MLVLKTVCLTALLVAAPIYAQDQKKPARRSKLRIKNFTKLTKLEFFVKTNVPGFEFQGHLKNPRPIENGRAGHSPQKTHYGDGPKGSAYARTDFQ